MNNFEGIREDLRADKQPSSQRNLAKKLGWLGPVRMLVIAIISFGYASTMPRGPQEKEYLNMLGYDPSWLGISVLFMITGYLAMRSLERHGSARKFIVSRVGRNLPMLLLFAALVILIVFPLFGVPMEQGGSRASQHLKYLLKVVSCLNPSELTPGLLDNALYMCVIHGGLWTFRWGLVAFIATAILWAFGALKNTRVLLFISAFVFAAHIGVLYYVQQTNALADPNASPLVELAATGLRLGWAYMAGMCAYAFRNKIPKSLFIPGGILCFAILNYLLLPWTPFIELTIDIAFGLVVLRAIRSTKEVPSLIKALPDLSLGLYIFNWPLAQLTLLMIPALSPLALFALSFPLTILLAYISWAALSRPINKHVLVKLNKKIA